MDTPTAPQVPDRSAESEGTLTYTAAWRTIRKYWITAIVVFVTVLLGTVFYTLGQKRIFEAVVSLQFDPSPPRPLGSGVETVVDMGNSNYWDNQEYYETQFRVLQSRRVARAVVQELRLHEDPGFIFNEPKDAPARTMAPVDEESAALTLISRVLVEPVKNSRLALVKYQDANPERARQIAATLAGTYLQMHMEDALTSTNSAADWLQGQSDNLKQDLESSELALHKYKEDKNILSVSLGDQTNMLRGEMEQLNETITTMKATREGLAARVDELRKVTSKDPELIPTSELLQNAALQRLRDEFLDAKRAANAAKVQGKGKNHPEMLAAESQQQLTRDALFEQIANIRAALESDLAVTVRQLKGLEALFEQANRQALGLNLLEIEFNRLMRAKNTTERLYGMVTERAKESDLTRALRVNNIRILDQPLLPAAPIRPNKFLNIALGALAGIFAGILVALLRGFLDRSVKTPDDLERDLGVTFLGLLPEISDETVRQRYAKKDQKARGRKDPLPERSELIVHLRPSSGVAEAARAIRTNLIFMAPDRPYRSLLVTSAGPSEGKTTVAACIAIAMAQAGQRVCLIDCDLRRPRIHRIFRRPSDYGLTTAIVDGGMVEAAPTEVPNLFVIPAGPIPPNPAELLHSERFKAFMAHIQTQFDRVIIDSPPVVAVTDAVIMSTQVDGTILVVRAFSTNKDLARHAVRSITDVGAKMVGSVLNAVNLDRHEYKYSYYYYRREDYGSKGDEKGSGDRAGSDDALPQSHTPPPA